MYSTGMQFIQLENILLGMLTDGNQDVCCIAVDEVWNFVASHQLSLKEAPNTSIKHATIKICIKTCKTCD